ncbi:MAG: hypothetical protein JPMHGGIA_00371 [Saprospiraceae bacterium]|jgi:hypothetical protein|nr:hypothetical protein [Saprospiraceae bacterium]
MPGMNFKKMAAKAESKVNPERPPGRLEVEYQIIVICSVFSKFVAETA